MRNDQSFGEWFRPLIEQTGLKKKAIAEHAGIQPESLSRILSGNGVAKETALSLARSLNELAGREIADEEMAIRLAVGLDAAGPEAHFDLDFLRISFKEDNISPEDREELMEDVRHSLERMRRRKEQEKTGDK